MKYAMFSPGFDPAPRLGLLRGDALVDLKTATPRDWPDAPTTLVDLIHRGPDAWQRMAEIGAEASGAHSHTARPSAGMRRFRVRQKMCSASGSITPPTPRKARRRRGREMKIPTVPVIFTKAPTTVTGPFDDIPVDRQATQQVDWEVELGVVIGRTGRNIAKADALRHVFGYTVINDLSARDLQQQHMQWFKGKSLDGFCPMGPVVVTADEFGDPQAKRLQLRVNGVTKQDGLTANMIFPVDVIIEWLSKGLTLEAGRHHRHGHAGRRGHGPHTTGISAERRRDRNRGRRDRRSCEIELSICDP